MFEKECFGASPAGCHKARCNSASWCRLRLGENSNAGASSKEGTSEESSSEEEGSSEESGSSEEESEEDDEEEDEEEEEEEGSDDSEVWNHDYGTENKFSRGRKLLSVP